jgi:hypothetical protein
MDDEQLRKLLSDPISGRWVTISFGRSHASGDRLQQSGRGTIDRVCVA